jgi:hypothetical protein
LDGATPPPGDRAQAIDGFLLALLDGAERFAAANAPPRFALGAGPLDLTLEVGGALYARRLTAGFATPASGGNQGLRVIALDGAATGLGAPGDWHFPVTQRGHLERLHEQPALGLTARFDPDTLTWRVLSLPRRLAVVWTADAAGLPEWEDAAPLRDIIHWASAPHPWLLAHAACVGQGGRAGGRAVLLAGAGGAGKSTTTAACVLAGMQTTGDDFVLADPDARVAHALYDTIKLGPESLALLPGWAGAIANPGRDADQKARIHLRQARPGALASTLKLGALLLPAVSGAARTTIAPAQPGEAMRALVPSTAFLLRGGAAGAIRKAGVLARALPAFRLSLGPDPAEAAAVIAAFLRRGG